MLRFLVPITIVLSSATSYSNKFPHRYQQTVPTQIASESQVKFALESRYDDTGPGAKQPESAYSTYNNIEDALVAYLDDPDTKLPENEKMKAIKKLKQSQAYYIRPNGAYTGRLMHKQNIDNYDQEQFRPMKFQSGSLNYDAYNVPVGNLINPDSSRGQGLTGSQVAGQFLNDKRWESHSYYKIPQPVQKSYPLSLAHYARYPEQRQQQSEPQQIYEYLANDKSPELKPAHESSEGKTFHGFYSFIGADGLTRTVHYTADDLAFRPNVQ